MELKKAFGLILSIGFIIAFYLFFRWTGYKGLIAFVVGMLIMAVLILTKNPLLKFAIKMTSSDDYIEEIKR